MKKTSAWVLLCLLASAAAAPALIGLKLERDYQATVDQMIHKGLKLVRSEYRRGWLSSEAEMDLLLARPTGDGQDNSTDLVLTLRNRIEHGPLIADGSILMARMETQLLADAEPVFPPDRPAVVRTRMELLGRSTTMVINLPSREIAEADGHPGLEFEGLAGEVRFGETRDSLAGELELIGLAMVKDGQRVMRVGGVTANWQMRRGHAGLLFGDAALVLEDAELADPVQGTRVSLQGFAIASASSVLDDNVEMHLDYTLARASVDDRVYGPAELSIRLGNLSAQVLGRVREALAQTNTPNLDEEQKSLAVLDILMTNAPQMLRNDPNFAIERLHVETPDGAVEGSLAVQARGMVWPASDPAEALRKLNAEASLRLPEPVFRALLEPGARQRLVAALEARRLAGKPVEEPTGEQRQQEIQRMVEQQVADIVGQGILLRNGEELTLAVRLRRGRLELNGRDFPMPAAVRPRGASRSRLDQ